MLQDEKCVKNMQFEYNPDNKQHPCGFGSWAEHSEFHRDKIILGCKLLLIVTFIDAYVRDMSRRKSSNAYHMSLLNLSPEVLFHIIDIMCNA